MIHSGSNLITYKYLKQTIANPAVTTDVTSPSPVGYRAKIINLKFRLDTDANVGNRQLSVSNYSGGDFTILGGSQYVQAANTIYNYICHPGGPGSAAFSTTYLYINLPDLPTFQTGDVLRITNNGNQAGDQLQDIRVHWALWPCPAG